MSAIYKGALFLCVYVTHHSNIPSLEVAEAHMYTVHHSHIGVPPPNPGPFQQDVQMLANDTP